MIRAISRWQGLPGRGNPSQRWTRWTRSLTERHGRIPLRHGARAMILFQPLARLYLHCQRWQSHAWKLAPQINLAIAPILRQTVWKERPVLPPAYAGVNARRIASPSVQARGQAGNRVIFLNPLGSSSGRSTFSNREIGGRDGAPWQQVFGRADRINGVLQVNRSSLLVEESLRILRRVVHERQRVEERMQSSTVARQLVQHHQDRPSAAERTAMESQPLTKAGTRTWPQAASAPAINLDQLTEQVIRQLDHRLIAYRERMGKLF